jgi:rhodanese-related sulfurtransferase
MSGFPGRGPAIPTIDPTSAEARLRAGEAAPPILLDVREPYELAEIRAEGAVLAPLSGLGPRVNELPRDRPLFVICHSGSRSAQVTAYLLGNGWTDVSNVTGGMIAWQRAGLPVRTGTPDPSEFELPG